MASLREWSPIILDCLIVGGGPAGLTAGLYLGRFRRSVRVIDGGKSRTRWIPRSHNVPGFTEGVHGDDFLSALQAQAASYGAVLTPGCVEDIKAVDSGFCAMGTEPIAARRLILATGVVETLPPAPGMVQAIRQGLVRVCPICDGFEAQGRTVAVLGSGDHAAREALFLRTYATSVALILTPEDRLSPAMAEALAAAGVETITGEAGAITAAPGGVEAVSVDGLRRRFDVVYSAFGVTPQVKLARSLGVVLDEDGKIKVDDAQQTSVKGLFAIGDVVRGLNQINVAVGEAAIAATAVHNSLDRNMC